MGYKKLSKKLKDTKKGQSDTLLIKKDNGDDPNAPPYYAHPDVDKKRIGVDLSVILHQGLGTVLAAGEFQSLPKIPITSVEKGCTALIKLARRANMTLVVCADGMYHNYKASVNGYRKKKRMEAQNKLGDIFKDNTPLTPERFAEVKKLMKAAAHVTEEILEQAVCIFRQNMVEVYCAPFEADHQLAHWEKTGFTQGTISVDSDIFMLGSKLFIDCLESHSDLGKCFILERDDIMSQDAFGEGSSKWSDDQLLAYGGLCGCDWLQRLYRLQDKHIQAFMKKWVKVESEEEKLGLLKEVSENKHWPKDPDCETKGKGAQATDFPERFLQYLNFAKYAPVIRQNDKDVVEIGPLQDIPEGETRSWQELIGFDPTIPFSNLDVERCYRLVTFVRTGRPLRKFELPKDPLDSTKTLPHHTIIHFDKRPIDIYPANVLLDWLVFHGVPMPKSSKKADLVARVQLAVQNGQELDRERISRHSNLKSKSYISWENFVGVSDIQWNMSKTAVLDAIRKLPTVSENYIDTIFGPAKNGVRLRGIKRFESGSLDMSSLKLGSATLEGEAETITLLEIKCTPSMKTEVESKSI